MHKTLYKTNYLNLQKKLSLKIFIRELNNYLKTVSKTHTISYYKFANCVKQ